MGKVNGQRAGQQQIAFPRLRGGRLKERRGAIDRPFRTGVDAHEAAVSAAGRRFGRRVERLEKRIVFRRADRPGRRGEHHPYVGHMVGKAGRNPQPQPAAVRLQDGPLGICTDCP